MEYKMHKNGSYNIHTIKTNRFKNIRMEIILRNNVDAASLAKRTILFDMLMENSKDYKTKRDITLKLENLYNAMCYTVNTKLGNQVFTSIVMDFLNPKLTNDDYLEEAIKLPFDLLFNPNIENNEFSYDTLTTIKNRVISDIKCLNENPQKLSINNALKKMDDKSVSSLNINGTIDDIERINTINLVNTYKEILEHDYVDIFIIGEIDENKVIDLINKYASFKTIKNHPLKLYVDNKIRKKYQIIKEKSSFTQAQVVYLLNTVNLTTEEKKYAFIIYNMILGGGSLETKLYQNLRDKNSLCYGVISLYQKYDDLVIIHTSIDNENIELTNKLINKSIKEMTTNVSEDEVMRAVNAVINAINMSLDHPNNIIDQYLFSYISELDDIEKRIDNFRNVRVEDVLSVAKKVHLNTIYILESGEENATN